jgi:hypothetical protein
MLAAIGGRRRGIGIGEGGAEHGDETQKNLDYLRRRFIQCS